MDYIEQKSISRVEDSIDEDGHGSHIAAIIAQDIDIHSGISGIAFKTKLMPIRIVGTTDTYSLNLNLKHSLESKLALGIRFAVNNGADIINLSLEDLDNNPDVKKAIDYAYRKNVLVIAAGWKR